MVSRTKPGVFHALQENTATKLGKQALPRAFSVVKAHIAPLLAHRVALNVTTAQLASTALNVDGRQPQVARRAIEARTPTKVEA
jgi:hypothetical protein